jgi:hypothetical protein
VCVPVYNFPGLEKKKEKTAFLLGGIWPAMRVWQALVNQKSIAIDTSGRGESACYEPKIYTSI